MTKRAEFHQALITVQIRIVDDGRSYGLRTAQVTVLMDTDCEWQAAQDQIRQAVAQLNQELQDANSN